MNPNCKILFDGTFKLFLIGLKDFSISKEYETELKRFAPLNPVLNINCKSLTKFSCRIMCFASVSDKISEYCVIDNCFSL